MLRLNFAVKVLLIFVLLAGLATAGEPKKLRMAVATFSQSVLPMVVAQEKGYFREEDLDVELILMTASVANMALLGGSVDFISSGPSVVGAIARGAPLKFVFICFNRPMHWLYAKPDRDLGSGFEIMTICPHCFLWLLLVASASIPIVCMSKSTDRRAPRNWEIM